MSGAHGTQTPVPLLILIQSHSYTPPGAVASNTHQLGHLGVLERGGLSHSFPAYPSFTFTPAALTKAPKPLAKGSLTSLAISAFSSGVGTLSAMSWPLVTS